MIVFKMNIKNAGTLARAVQGYHALGELCRGRAKGLRRKLEKMNDGELQQMLWHLSDLKYALERLPMAEVEVVAETGDSV